LKEFLDRRGIARVTRTKEEARSSYDKMSPFYDLLAGAFERRHSFTALTLLNIAKGEKVLEIGFGTGHCLLRMAESADAEGRVFGIDLSTGMLELAARRLEKAGLRERVELTCGDAASLPYRDAKFDAVFLSFVLELFDTPEIPRVLAEIMRVLKPSGRLGSVAMSKEGGSPALLRLYEWMHERFPKTIDCRPIFAGSLIVDAGFRVECEKRLSLFGLPIDIVVATKPA
jgi:ubiquinone/menaquinone biosynthesis C-methylase UbiE